jgi:hypothetical protein
MEQVETKIVEIGDLLEQLKTIYDEEMSKLPYHMNLIDELRVRANENAHSRILEKLLKQKTHNGEYEILTNFIDYLKSKKASFAAITIEKPQITQEKQRIDLWIRDNAYAIIIENKVHWASDQYKQLERYIDITKCNNKSDEQIFVVYLSPTYAKDPDEESWGRYFDSDIYKSRYLKLSFREDILTWLKENVLPNIRMKDVYLRSAIEQYIDHLEGIFSLRTINNNQMNMKLKKIIEEKLKLEGSVFSEKHSVVENVRRVLETYLTEEKTEVIKPIKEIENKIRMEFTQQHIRVESALDYYDIYILFKISGVEINCTLSFRLDSEKYQSGVYSFEKDKDKEGKIPNFLNPLFNNNMIEKDEEWYGYKELDKPEDAYVHFKKLVYAVIEEKKKWDNQNE